jgi:hypothetical protein
MFPFVAGGTNIEPKQRKPIEAFTERLTNPSKDLMVKFINDEGFAKTMVKLDSERMMKYYEIQDIIRLNHMHLVGKPLEQIQKLNEERNDLLNEMIKYDTEKSSTEEAKQLIELQYINIQQEENFYIDRFLRNYNTEVKMPIQFGEDSTYNNAVRQIRFEDAKEDADRKIDFDLKRQYLPKLQMYANEVPAYKNRIMSEYLQWRQAMEAAKQELYQNSMKRKGKLSSYEAQALIRSKLIDTLTEDIKFRKKESYDWEAEAEIKQLKEMEDKIRKDEPNLDKATLYEQRRELNRRIEEIKSKAKAADIKDLERLRDTIIKWEPTTKTEELKAAEQDKATAERKEASGGTSRPESPPKTKEYIEREEKIAFYKSQIDANKKVIDKLMTNPVANQKEIKANNGVMISYVDNLKKLEKEKAKDDESRKQASARKSKEQIEAEAAAEAAAAADLARRKAIQTALDNKRAAEAAAEAAAAQRQREIDEATTPVTGGSFVNKAGKVVTIKFAPAGGAAPAAGGAGKTSLISLRSKSEKVPSVDLLKKFL